mmetsp:Transcript_6845/g.14104  ORF Transcript_6845/g.14104 Transcript_6845/m.14104 type:complete len:269 (+) Transcript_6845:175-981(+)
MVRPRGLFRHWQPGVESHGAPHQLAPAPPAGKSSWPASSARGRKLSSPSSSLLCSSRTWRSFSSKTRVVLVCIRPEARTPEAALGMARGASPLKRPMSAARLGTGRAAGPGAEQGLAQMRGSSKLGFRATGAKPPPRRRLHMLPRLWPFLPQRLSWALVPPLPRESARRAANGRVAVFPSAWTSAASSRCMGALARWARSEADSVMSTFRGRSMGLTALPDEHLDKSGLGGDRVLAAHLAAGRTSAESSVSTCSGSWQTPLRPPEGMH